MIKGAHFYSVTNSTPANLIVKTGAVLFHGIAVDQRGQSAVEFQGVSAAEKISFTYDYYQMTVKVGDEESSADHSANLMRNRINDRPVILEATTLGFAELFCCIHGLVSLGIKQFEIIYVEPAEYSKPPGEESYALSDIISGYHPIPHSVIDLSSDEVEAGVFFLGYEQGRMERALSEYQMITSKEVKVVFGVPAYRPGWELNAMVPHLEMLTSQPEFEIAYCAANDPGSAYDCLQATRKSLTQGKKMFVAPIGTKPCGIAAAVFASIFPDEVGLLYDHPKKKKSRSKGVNIWHKYTVTIDQ